MPRLEKLVRARAPGYDSRAFGIRTYVPMYYAKTGTWRWVRRHRDHLSDFSMAQLRLYWQTLPFVPIRYTRSFAVPPGELVALDMFQDGKYDLVEQFPGLFVVEDEA